MPVTEVPAGATVLIPVSGGIDSVAALWETANMAPVYAVRIPIRGLLQSDAYLEGETWAVRRCVDWIRRHARYPVIYDEIDMEPVILRDGYGAAYGSSEDVVGEIQFHMLRLHPEIDFLTDGSVASDHLMVGGSMDSYDGRDRRLDRWEVTARQATGNPRLAYLKIHWHDMKSAVIAAMPKPLLERTLSCHWPRPDGAGGWRHCADCPKCREVAIWGRDMRLATGAEEDWTPHEPAIDDRSTRYTWFEAPQAYMPADPPYIVVQGVLPVDALDRFYADLKDVLAQPGKLEYRTTPGENTRANTVAWLTPDPVYGSWYQTRIENAARQVNAAHWNLDIGGPREMLYSHYVEGEGYAWHHDVEQLIGHRTLSMVVELRSTPGSGGGIEFEGAPAPGIGAGDAVLFPSTRVHRAREVTSGWRDSLIYWMCRA